MNTIKDLKEAFNNIDKMRSFEIEVIDKRTDKVDYIIFDIELVKNSLVATHTALNSKQEKSKKVPFISLALDKFHSLDQNLEFLYENCVFNILQSEFFTLTN